MIFLRKIVDCNKIYKCQVCLSNIEPEIGIVNGFICGFESGFPIVEFTVHNRKIQRTITPITETIELENKIVASRRQVPLSISVCMTIHKSQGSTWKYHLRIVLLIVLWCMCNLVREFMDCII